VGNGRTAEEKESEPAGGSDHFLHKGKIPEEMLSQKTTVERPLAANTSKI